MCQRYPRRFLRRRIQTQVTYSRQYIAPIGMSLPKDDLKISVLYIEVIMGYLVGQSVTLIALTMTWRQTVITMSVFAILTVYIGQAQVIQSFTGSHGDRGTHVLKHKGWNCSIYHRHFVAVSRIGTCQATMQLRAERWNGIVSDHTSYIRAPEG